MQLRAHQREALDAIEGAVLAGERRMTVVAACGTGKTLIALRAAQLLAPQGAVLILMPTKALLTQTIRRWREAGRPGLALGVCSLTQGESGLTTAEAVMTRRPSAIAGALHSGGAVTVFATYGSLHHLQRAHEGYGLPPWDLVIVDEAHRTCSAFGDGWGTIHDDAAIPAKIRIYMTATPRIWGSAAETPDQGDAAALFMERIPLATMDHLEIFGPTVFELGMAEAIERGILADYQVVMPIVDDSDLHTILAARRTGTTAHHNGLRNGAIQVALLRAIVEHGLRRVLVFHNRVAAAAAFAATLPRTAVEVGKPLRMEGIWSHVIHGEQDNDWRRNLLDDFADPDRRCAVLSNVRVLNEGVDMPDVDAVAFADPRYSAIDAIQAIGRGLRQPPGAGKKTTLVIPVYLNHSASRADLLRDSAFENLVTILQALRAHDNSFMDRIALPDRWHSAKIERRHVFYAQPERAAQLARALGLEITVPAIGTWEQALASATCYRTAFGHLDVPAGYTAPDGFALGECLLNLRLRYFLGRLPADHKQALDALGIRWTTKPQTFESMLEHVRAWAAEHDHLSVPVTTEIGGHPIGKWLATQRRKATVGKLSRAQQEALSSIDPCWNPPWPLEWQRKYIRAKALGGFGIVWRSSSQAPDDGSREDRAMADWIFRQRRQFFDLRDGQQQLLLGIGIPPYPDAVKPSCFHNPEQHTFCEGLAHAADYLAREGHLNVPRNHREPVRSGEPHQVGFPLGIWIHQCRKSIQTLTDQQRRALEAVRMVWDPDLGRRKPPKSPATK
jgi:superfamily II DNA or RNA helicase